MLLLVVSNSQDGFQELGIIETVHAVKSLGKWDLDTIDFSH
jgi:hypothetical protein